ncbi:DUF4145 domain-containing protein [Propionibacteriaceae bacterium Y1700]|uniref:DUF4145 domain-containing protein n=1 Tax=Microlunatus sp. Y1700 TaxID=3418487 RepID=UPI003DA7392B
MVIFENDTGVCPNCDLGSAFQQQEHVRIWPQHYRYGWGSHNSPPQEGVWIDLTTISCLHCSKTVVYRDQFARVPVDDGAKTERRLIHRTLVYPALSPRELNKVVPEAIHSFFREASLCEQTGALRGASVLYRAAVEELIKDQGATGSTLYARIEDLKSGPAADLVDDFHEARMLGNDSIHDGLVYTAEEVEDIANLIDEATVVLYVQPAERKRLRQSRQYRRTKNGTGA